MNKAILLFILLALSKLTFGSSHLGIQHCYHWLDEGNSDRSFLTFKYNHADKNSGELTFYTNPSTSKGAVAGPGLYCAMTPYGSYSYGDRVIRVQFVDDVVILDATSNRNYCQGYISQRQCDQKPWDVKFYSGGPGRGHTWYVIRNPNAIASWSANSRALISDLRANPNYDNTSARPNAFTQHIDDTIRKINSEIRLKGQRIIYNDNARASIVDIIKEKPEDLRKFPALNLLDRLAQVTEEQLPKELLDKTISDIIERVINDHKLNLPEMIASLQKRDLYKELFIKRINEMSAEEETEFSVILFIANESFSEVSFSNEKVLSLLSSIFSDYHQLERFVDLRTQKQSFGFQNFRSMLSQKISDINSIDPSHYHAYIKLIDRVVTDASEIKRLKGVFVSKLTENVKERMKRDNAQLGLEVSLPDGFEYLLYGDPEEIRNQCFVYDSISNFSSQASISLSAGDMDLGDFQNISNATAACDLMESKGLVVHQSNEYFKIHGEFPKNIIKAKIGNYEFMSYVTNRSQFLAQCLQQFENNVAGPYLSTEVQINGSQKRNNASAGDTADFACGSLVELIGKDLPKTKDKKEKLFYARGYIKEGRNQHDFHFVLKKSKFRGRCTKFKKDVLPKNPEVLYMSIRVVGHGGVNIDVDTSEGPGLTGNEICGNLNKYSREYFIMPEKAKKKKKNK